MSIGPEGFSNTHARGGAEHRLRSGEIAQKWTPLGVGSIDTNNIPVTPQLKEGNGAEVEDEEASEK
jgi:hypothetical protein